MEVKFEDHSKEVLSAAEKAKKRALWAIGAAAEGHAKEDPNMPVDTGRARNSIAFATYGKSGTTIDYDSETKKEKKQTVKTEDKDSVYLGSNVDYFPYIELGALTIFARHVLYNAATGHGQEYKDLAEESYKNA